MYVLKGFAAHASLANNTPGTINKIGELSAYSATYSFELGTYTDSMVAPGSALITFKSATDGVNTVVPNAIATLTLQVTAAIFQKTFDNPTLQIDQLEFAQIAQAVSADLREVRIGTVENDGTFYVPSWFSFKMASVPDATIKIWMSDSAFRNQYDEYNIRVVSPIWPLDDFFKDGATVKGLLDLVTPSVMGDKLQALKVDKPETILNIPMFNYYDPVNSSRIVPSYWGVLINGIAGNNIDAIKEAIVNYILANSARPRDDWAKILPELFRRSEFVFVPNWGKYSIPNRVMDQGYYSPVVGLGEMTAIMRRIVTTEVGYQPSHINANATVMSHHYRCLIVGCIGNVENFQSKIRIDDLFPDYMALSSTQLEWSSQSEPTRRFSYALAELIVAAEAFVEDGEIPAGMMKVVRGPRIFLSKNVDGYNMLVLTKDSYDG